MNNPMYIKKIKSLYVFYIFIVGSHMLTYTDADREGTDFGFSIHSFYQFDIGGS